MARTGKATLRSMRVFVFGAALAGLMACTPQFRNHGYAPSDEDLSEIIVGVDTKDTVADVIGAPSSSGVLRESGYYYVSQRIRTFAYQEPRIIDRQVVAISFDKSGVVQNIERFTLEDGNVVALSRRVTTSNVQGISFLRQLLGNLGRFSPSADL